MDSKIVLPGDPLHPFDGAYRFCGVSFHSTPCTLVIGDCFE